jgi:hypothetical protein
MEMKTMITDHRYFGALAARLGCRQWWLLPVIPSLLLCEVGVGIDFVLALRRAVIAEQKANFQIPISLELPAIDGFVENNRFGARCPNRPSSGDDGASLLPPEPEDALGAAGQKLAFAGGVTWLLTVLLGGTGIRLPAPVARRRLAGSLPEAEGSRSTANPQEMVPALDYHPATDMPLSPPEHKTRDRKEQAVPSHR